MSRARRGRHQSHMPHRVTRPPLVAVRALAWISRALVHPLTVLRARRPLETICGLAALGPEITPRSSPLAAFDTMTLTRSASRGDAPVALLLGHCRHGRGLKGGIFEAMEVDTTPMLSCSSMLNTRPMGRLSGVPFHRMILSPAMKYEVSGPFGSIEEWSARGAGLCGWRNLRRGTSAPAELPASRSAPTDSRARVAT